MVYPATFLYTTVYITQYMSPRYGLLHYFNMKRYTAHVEHVFREIESRGVRLGVRSGQLVHISFQFRNDPPQGSMRFVWRLAKEALNPVGTNCRFLFR